LSSRKKKLIFIKQPGLVPFGYDDNTIQKRVRSKYGTVVSLKICSWAMNLSACSKRGVGVFSRNLSLEIGPPHSKVGYHKSNEKEV